MSDVKSWIGPAIGIVFVALFVAISLMFGDGKDPTENSAQEVIDFYKDNEDKQTIAALLVGLASIAGLFFGGWLRRVLRDAEGPGGTLSAVAFAGMIVFVAGAIVSGTLHLELADYADNTDTIDPAVIQTLNAFEFNFFLFFPVGLGTMLLASGLSVIRHGAFPKWVGWFGLVSGILFVTPAFFVGFVLVPVWILIVSIIGISRARAGEAPLAAPAAP
jgi:MFS family permease